LFVLTPGAGAFVQSGIAMTRPADVGVPITRGDEMRSIRFARAASVVGFVLALAAAAAHADMKIGSVVSVTGPAAFLGSPEKRALEIYVDKINASGGVLGEKIRLIVYDDTSKADQARTFATRLVEDDEVVAVVGGSATGISMAMLPVFEEA